MTNKITAGRFKGKRIQADSEGVFISFGREHLDITHEIVDHIRIMSVAQNRSFFSSFIRGFFARQLGDTVWFSAIQSAQEKSQYRLRIAYRDGTASICVVDSYVLDQLAVTFDFL